MLLKERKTPRRTRGEGGDAFERYFPSPVTLAGSMQVLFNAPSSFVLRRLRLVLHPSQIHQPRYFHCTRISTSQVGQKRGSPEHPTPLPCIAINRAARTSSLERLVCMRISREAQNWQNTQLSGTLFRPRPSPVRRPLLPCPLPS